MMLRYPLPLRLFSLTCCLLLSACPGDDTSGTTEAASSTAGSSSEGTATATSTTASTDPTVGTTIEPGTSSTTATAGTTVAEGTTDAPSIACEDANTEKECSAAGGIDFECGWFPTRHHVVADAMCMEVAQGGVCLTISQDDGTCGLRGEPSCMDVDVIVFVRPSSEQDGAYETLALGVADACTGPAPGDGWEQCDPTMPVAGCRCGCG